MSQNTNKGTKAAKVADKASAIVREDFAFEKENYIWMLIGLGVLILGFLLMSGGGSKDPNVFDPEIFSFRRITLAPIVILVAFAIEAYAILLKPKK